jgi:hypothetical protein
MASLALMQKVFIYLNSILKQPYKSNSMNKKIITLLTTSLFFCVGFCQNKNADKVFDGKTPSKKLIQLGWEQPSPQVLQKNYKMMEAATPFDGLVIGLRDTVNGFPINDAAVFSGKAIKKEWLQKSAAAILSCHFTKLKYNFLRVNTVPGNLKWNDDNAWKIAAANMGVMAWFAKTTGLTGICYDPESYGAMQFGWSQKTGLSFFEAQYFARKRGGQIMAAIKKEYPNITLFGLFMFSLLNAALQSGDVHEVLKTDNYALYPAFLNGMLDELPPTAKMVEGNEMAYYAETDESLHTLYNNARNKSLALVAPENKNKFKNFYSIGFGQYVDMYSNEPDSKFYFGALPNRTRLARFRDRLTAALNISDEYVWVYNEQYKWWDIPYSENEYNSNQKDSAVLLCEQKLPGITKSMEYAKSPVVYAKKLLTINENFTNLVINPGFEQQAAKAAEMLDWYNKDCPGGYLLCKDKNTTAVVLVEPNAGINQSNAAVATADGSFVLIQTVKVIPGETYAVSVDGKKTGGTLVLGISWLDDNNNLVAWHSVKNIAFMPVQNNVWSNAATLTPVPAGIQTMALLLSAIPADKKDKFYFDNIKVVEVNDLLRRN